MKKKATAIHSGGKITGKIFQDAEVCVLVNFLPRKETVNAVHYVQRLQKL
jgi:hypothetical protein